MVKDSDDKNTNDIPFAECPYVETFKKPPEGSKALQRLDVDYWAKLTEGQAITGVFDGFRTMKQSGRMGERDSFRKIPILVRDGKKIGLPSHEALITMLADVPNGTEVCIVNRGETPAKSGGRSWYVYDVYLIP